MSASNELYNLRWNCFVNNLLTTFTEHQSHEYLVDVSIGCEGQFLKAHRIVLAASSSYFEQIFESHTVSPLLILLNDVKFEHLKLIVQFMYKGEVKVSDSDIQKVLQLGRMLNVKGLNSVELQHKSPTSSEKKSTSINAKNSDNGMKKAEMEAEHIKIVPNFTVAKKRKLSVKELESQKKIISAPVSIVEKQKSILLPISPVERQSKGFVPRILEKKKHAENGPRVEKDASSLQKPQSAFMIFANQWRKKLAIDYPKESNKEISVRLGNMWKCLQIETKDAFYEDARKAEEDYRKNNPGYTDSIDDRTKTPNNPGKSNETSNSDSDCVMYAEPEFVEVICKGENFEI